VEKDGIPTHEGLILRHSRTGQGIFVAHGHQADFTSDRLCAVARFLVRRIWKRLQLLGLVGTASPAIPNSRRGLIEQRLIDWVQAHQQITICGHTHHPSFARYGALPYFNTGSCVYYGHITSLELQDGQLMPVKWAARPAKRTGAPTIARELISPPTELRLLGI
jgi:hypothetical protein